VAQVVEPDRWGVDLADQQPEAVGAVTGADRRAVGADKHVAGAVPRSCRDGQQDVFAGAGVNAVVGLRRLVEG
jgi:hypothetical protein